MPGEIQQPFEGHRRLQLLLLRFAGREFQANFRRRPRGLLSAKTDASISKGASTFSSTSELSLAEVQTVPVDVLGDAGKDRPAQVLCNILRESASVGPSADCLQLTVHDR